MTNIHIVVEGQTDAEIIKKLIPYTLLSQTVLHIGGGRYGAQSLASSIIAKRQEPTALIIDIDSQNRDDIVEKTDFSTSLMRRVASGVPYKVIAAIPTIEIVILQSRSLIERIAHHKFSALEWELAHSNPKTFLYEALGKLAMQALLNAATEDELVELQTHPLIIELIDFLTTVKESV